MFIPVEVEVADLKVEESTNSLDCSKDDDRHDDGMIFRFHSHSQSKKINVKVKEIIHY